MVTKGSMPQRQMDMRIGAAQAVQVCAFDAAAFGRQFRMGERLEISFEQREAALGMSVEMQKDLMIDVTAHLAWLR